jgi:hypothetical protein
MTFCHFLVEVRRWVVGMPAKMVSSRSTQWRGGLDRLRDRVQYPGLRRLPCGPGSLTLQ